MEDVFWVDKIAREVAEREKKLNRTQIYRTEMGLGASGIPHVGSAGDGVRSYVVYLALKNAQHKSEFIAFSDDRDGLRKVPAGFPESMEKDIGKPVSLIDDPYGCHESFGLHISSLLIDGFEKIGVTFTLKRAHIEYAKGTLDSEITEILSNAKRAGEIIQKTLGQKKYTEQLPYLPICEKCGRVYTTRAYAFDGTKILYKCDLAFEGKNTNSGKIVEIKGCGHDGECTVREGKLSWKVEFAARWRALKINYEAYGKDILDSVRCNDEISRQILNYEPPTHSFYELFTERSGKKISKSAGNVFTPQMWLRYASPQSLRLLYLKKLATTRVVDPDAIPAYMDEVDELGRVYFGQKQVTNEKEKAHLRRLFEYVHFLSPPEQESRIDIHYNMLAEIYNISKHKDVALRILQRTGHIPEHLTPDEKSDLYRRLDCAKNWLVDTVREETSLLPLEPAQKDALRLLAKSLRDRQWTEEELYTYLFDLPKQIGLTQAKFFEAAYLVLLNNRRGPRLAQLILELEPQVVARTLEERLGKY